MSIYRSFTLSFVKISQLLSDVKTIDRANTVC